MKSLKWILLTAALMVLTFVTVSGTLGNTDVNGDYLYVVQSELMRSDSGLVDAGDNRKLLPGVYEKQVESDKPTQTAVQLERSFSVTDKEGHTVNVGLSTTKDMYDVKNAMDYIVVATNTGNVDGFVRTWFAFEMGDLTEAEFKTAVLLNQNTADWTWKEVQYGKEINGQRYAVVCAEYVDEQSRESKKLPAGATTEPSLLQVMLYSTVSNNTVKRLDGDNDDNYEILVSSRIISDSGAWGAFTDYSFPTAVTTGNELQNAINNGATNIILGDDIDLSSGLIFG